MRRRARRGSRAGIDPVGGLPKPVRRLALGLAALLPAGFVAAGLLVAADRAYPPAMVPPGAASPIVLDRDGRLLSAFTDAAGRWRLPSTEPVDPRFEAMLIAYEDRRFATHGGVDPLATLRAFGHAVLTGTINSGASTLTMQVVRLVEGRTERTLSRKLLEMVRAVQLERRLTKRQILDLYLAVAPYGGNLEGARAAALSYFGREPGRLTLGEAALLVALPQSPERRRPDRYPEAARAGRDRVLDRALARGVITTAEAARAKAEPIPTQRLPFPALAAHAARRAVAEGGGPIHRLTLERDLQAALEPLVAERAGALGDRVSGAIVVLDAATGAIRARVAAADAFDDARDGYVDMTLAARSPGSTLKPFVYGLAFEAGLAHPETLVEDRPTDFGGYRPRNFDGAYQGTLTAREALELSLNVPAVALLEAVGPQRLAVRLAGAGAPLELPTAEAASLAVGLGGVGIRLVDLASLYAAFPRDGTVPRPFERLGTAPAAAPRLLDPPAAWQVARVLAGTPPPANARSGGIAYKTGTSYGYRDAWAVGFDGATVIAAWLGRPDGSPVPGLVGGEAAAPMLFDAFARLGEERVPLPPAPPGTLIATTATLPPPLRRFGAAREGPATLASADPGLRFAYPPNGARVSLLAPDGGRQPLAWRIEGAARAAALLVDGKPVAVGAGRSGAVPLPGRGFVRLTVVDGTGGADSVTVFVE